MTWKRLEIAHLNDKMKQFAALESVPAPPHGWVSAVRYVLGISLEQIGRKLSITKQSVRAIEEREKDGSITIRSLREAADALDMQLVYGFVPKDGSLYTLIDRKAQALAEQIVRRASATMVLEDQANSPERIQAAIREKAEEIKNEMPKALWD